MESICTKTGWSVLKSTGPISPLANGISIVAEPQRVAFIEAIDGKATTEVAIPGMARKYVQALPNVEYQAMGLNPRGYATFAQGQDAARNYLAETLLSPGPWNEVGIRPMQATVNYTFMLERGQFNLSVSEATWRQQDETTTPIVLFSGNFAYDIAGNSTNERLHSLVQILENWQIDLMTYIDTVNGRFLTASVQTTAIVPDLFAMSPAT